MVLGLGLQGDSAGICVRALWICCPPIIILRSVALHEQMGGHDKREIYTLINNTSFSKCHNITYPSYMSSGGKGVIQEVVRV